MRLKKNATSRERYEEFLSCTQNLDDSPRMTELKQAVWNSMFKSRKKKKRQKPKSSDHE